MTTPLLKVNDLKVHFDIPDHRRLFAPKQTLKAVDGISFELQEGETLGVVGESGCGKSTLARAILQLVTPSGGDVLLNGQSLLELDRNAMREARRQIQVIFQDPLAALNPRMTLLQIIGEPLTVYEPHLSAAERKERVLDIMERVGLSRQMINRYPHEFSGGQCQRIGIARALILKPKLIICDEPVSALDVSIRAQIVNLLLELQQEMGLSLIFIAHDLHIVRHISHKIMVMYLGKAVEMGDSESVYHRPMHPYTRALIDSVLVLDPEASPTRTEAPLEGDLPSPLNPPSGCPFRTRCPMAKPHCADTMPPLSLREDEYPRLVACHEV
ncbi:ABC transporter ATP-binding protein [Gilvimarinus sp. F26214L]|uniref:ABC transporter ATP-binding protein n=1 Tax=Gilvimarinus sp. DZF01 TaxID=3461371 RepID=UPI004046603C